MTVLRDAAERIARSGRLPGPSDRLLALERLLSGAGRAPDSDYRGIDGEEWTAFVARVDLAALDRLRPKEFRQLLDGIWNDESLDEAAASVLDHAVAEERKSYDRTTLLAYLRHFPTGHPIFDRFAAACELVARRHDWPWRERGDKWLLWRPGHGPARLADALLRDDDPAALLRDAGLDLDLAEGGYVEEALAEACRNAATQRGPAAELAGTRLVALFDRLGAKALDPMLAYALLKPWFTTSPSDGHRRSVMRILVARLGDPRLHGARWASAKTNVSEWADAQDIEATFAVLRRWLVHATVHEFFKVIGQTTDRADQWAAREAFWLGYLDQGMIADAWFAFGPHAEQRVRSLLRDETVGYARVVGGGADPSHSSLIMSIGDLRVAEWSHNGACRFWRAADPRAPAMYAPTYNGNSLRAMAGGAGFDHISHTSRWEGRFARHIYHMTGLQHPVHGRGW